MSEAIQTAGDLRGFLAGVLLDIKAKRIKPDEAVSIAKVAAEINKSLAVEIQTALAVGVKKPVPGSMVIGNEYATEHSKNITQNIPSVVHNHDDGEKVWCEQCEMRVTVGQAVGCKSAFCKAKEAA